MPAFSELLQGVERAYREQKEAIATQTQSLMAAFAALEPSGAEPPSDPSLMKLALGQLADSFDTRCGGFGRAPKFPHATGLELLLRRYAASVEARAPDAALLHRARFTLEGMVRGGLNDQLGGGFCRYSIDDLWQIPHFEKMLYDNGPLLALCCDAFAITGETLLRDAAVATADWLRREMQAPEGGFYSSLDADSEGQEGRYYVWDREAVRALLTPAEYAPFAVVYGLDHDPNFEGAWHLRRWLRPEAAARRLGLKPEVVQGLLATARATLLASRERRARPGRDDKILTAWNALAIKGMARAARVLGRPDYLESAEAALGFIRASLWRGGRLLASYKDGEARLGAYLDDYANLLDALLELLQVRWSRSDLDLAVVLAQILLDQFQDPLAGGFWFTARDHESLIHRPKPLADESLPAGNGVAAFALQRLGHLLGEPRYLEAARRTLGLAAPAMAAQPYAHASLLFALEEYLAPPEVMVIRADQALLEDWQAVAQQGYRPHRLVFAIPKGATQLPGALAAMHPGPGPRAYRCRGTHCEAPVLHLAEL